MLFCVRLLSVLEHTCIYRIEDEEMLISYKWLKDYVDSGLDPKELGEKLTLIGLEIDGIEERGDDIVYDIEVTSNRGDCLSHIGVAREISAALRKELVIPEGARSEARSGDLVSLEAPLDCLRFTARVIKGIKVAPSPDWLVERLEAVGERSINNVADITNYVMHELGNPMHAFDLNKLSEERIVVRRAHESEKIVTLDEVERELTADMLAICDAERPVAVAGVMGGLESGIDEASENMLLEVAYFDRDLIRKTSSALGLSTEASYRFERGIDIENIVRASNRATELILELAGGEDTEFIDVYPQPRDFPSLEAPNLVDEVTRLSGLSLSREEIDTALGGLGIEREGDTYSSPSWRHDIAITADLVEEAVRIHGYDRIGENIPPAFSSGEYHQSEGPKRAIRNGLASNGFLEAFSYSFVEREKVVGYSILGAKDESGEITINDPIIEGADLMRRTLIPGLVEAVRLNANFKSPHISMFEIGRIFQETKSAKLPAESEFLGLVISGKQSFSDSPNTGRKFDFFDLKSVVEMCFEWGGFGIPEFQTSDDSEHLQNGQGAEIYSGTSCVGTIGKLSDRISKQYKFKEDVFVAEIDLSSLIELDSVTRVYRPLPKFPGTQRDVSLVIDQTLRLETYVKRSPRMTSNIFEM